MSSVHKPETPAVTPSRSIITAAANFRRYDLPPKGERRASSLRTG